MPGAVYNRAKGDIAPLSNHVLVINMEQGEKKLASGLIVLDDNGKDRGIRPRWAEVYKVGKNVDFVEPGQWVLLEHGRWTYGLNLDLTDGGTLYVQRADTDAILLVADECPL